MVGPAPNIGAIWIIGEKAMANPVELGAASGQKLDTILQRLRQSKDITPHLQQVLDVAIAMAAADMGTLQRIDEENDSLRIVASRGFSTEALKFIQHS